MRILGRREHSAEQLKRKLEVRGHDEARAVEVVARLAESGWQSDSRFAETLARSRAGQGFGPLRIKAELQAAGVSDAEIREAMDAVDCDFTEAARKLQARHFHRMPASPAERQKQYRYLAGRGFDAEQVRAVLKGDPEE
jgi:regulatory protein